MPKPEIEHTTIVEDAINEIITDENLRELAMIKINDIIATIKNRLEKVAPAELNDRVKYSEQSKYEIEKWLNHTLQMFAYSRYKKKMESLGKVPWNFNEFMGIKKNGADTLQRNWTIIEKNELDIGSEIEIETSVLTLEKGTYTITDLSTDGRIILMDKNGKKNSGLSPRSLLENYCKT